MPLEIYPQTILLLNIIHPLTQYPIFIQHFYAIFIYLYSGLAVEPNPGFGGGGSGNVSDNILAQASQQSSSDGQVTRRITMYRSGFVVDDGPYRRLDDPNNSEFLRDLARGVSLFC